MGFDHPQAWAWVKIEYPNYWIVTRPGKLTKNYGKIHHFLAGNNPL